MSRLISPKMTLEHHHAWRATFLSLSLCALSACTASNPDYNPRLSLAGEGGGGERAGAMAGQSSATAGGGVEGGQTGGQGGEPGGLEAGVGGVRPCVGELEGDCDGDGVAVTEGDCNDADAEVYPGAAERCDGVDRNCDGVIGGEIQSCYTGPDGSQAVGRCQSGIQRCDGSSWGACEEELTPLDEACDGESQGLDDDCDGQVDEGCDLDGDGLSPAEGDCDDNDPNIYPGAPDLCDGINSDCDDQTDEELSSCYDGDPREIGVGVCQEGRLSCVEGRDGSCQGQTLPSQERCGAAQLDEDCDGRVDEGCEQASCQDLDLDVPLTLSTTCMIADQNQQTVIRLRPTTISGGPLPAGVTFSLNSGIQTDTTGPFIVNGEWVWIVKAPFANVDFNVSASAHCDDGPPLAYTNQAEINVRLPITSAQGLEFGACRAAAGNLLVTVLDDDTGARVPGASVMVGDEPLSSWQVDPYAWLRGEPGQSPNTATTNLAGQVKFVEYSGYLSAPFNLTVTAPGYEYVTIINMNSPQVTLQLKRSQYPEGAYFAQGDVQDFNDTSNDGEADIALVMPSITLRELSTLNTSKLLSRGQCWTPNSLLPSVEIPSNLYVPSQRERGEELPYSLSFGIAEHRYRVSDRSRASDHLVALGGKISTQKTIEALESGDTTLAQLLAEVSFKEIGVRRNQSFSTNSNANNTNIPLSLDLSESASCTVSNVPDNAYVTCLSAGAWPDEPPNNEDARLFPMGIVNITADELDGAASVTKPLTVAPASGDLNGVIYLGATVALFGDETPEYSDAVSAVIKRNSLNASGGSLSVGDFFSPLILSQEGRSYSWSPAQNENSPLPHLCELELRAINRIDYNPGSCADLKSREVSKPLWRVFMVQDPQSVTLPTPPQSWPRGGEAGLLDPALLTPTERMQAQIRCMRIFYNSDDLNFENRSWSNLSLSHVTFNTLDLSVP